MPDAFIGISGGGSVRVNQAPTFYDPAYDPAGRDAERSSSAAGLDDLILGPRPTLSEAKSAPWAIPESVYFIYRGRRPGDSGPRQPPLATAFVLAVPSVTRSNPNQLLRFLVTARHVVDPAWAHCAESNPASIDLRLNRREGGLGYETVSLQDGDRPRFFTPADPTADLAVIPLDNALIARLDDYKFLDIPFRLLLNSSEMPLLQLQQPVMTAGLSTLPAGGPASFPIFNAGFLSQMPAEAVDVRCGMAQPAQSPATLLHIWFIDAGLPPGVSGAPVFTSIAHRPGTAKTPVLLGIQSVVWPDRGIAGITPSPVLGDLIRSVIREERTRTRPDVFLKSSRLSASTALSHPPRLSATAPRGIQIQ